MTSESVNTFGADVSLWISCTREPRFRSAMKEK
jgi:hypothetical protein